MATKAIDITGTNFTENLWRPWAPVLSGLVLQNLSILNNPPHTSPCLSLKRVRTPAFHHTHTLAATLKHLNRHWIDH